jgi:hypothetical protein
MKNRIPFLCLVVVFGAIALVQSGAAAQQFSADLVATRSGGTGQEGGAESGQPMRSQKIFVSNDKIRMEGGQGKGGFVLVDSAAQTAVVVMPEQKMIMESRGLGNSMQIVTHLDPRDPCPQFLAIAKKPGFGKKSAEDGAWTCKRLGDETIEGRSTEKFEVVSPKGEHQVAWIDPDLRFPVKAEGPKGGMVLKNIQEGPQPAELFVVPADYKKMDLQEMMKGLKLPHKLPAMPN